MAFHLAARFVSQHTPNDVSGLVHDNVLFSAQLYEALANSRCKGVVTAGTGWQHQVSAPDKPVNLYAATKQAAQDLLGYFVDISALRAVTLKFFDTYGPGDDRPKLFAALRQASESGVALSMSPGEQFLDLVHIDDVVNAFLIAGERVFDGEAEPNEKFAVLASERHTLREVVELYRRATGNDVGIVWGGRPYRPREVMVPWVGEPLPGWQPRIRLEDGLRTLNTDG